MILADTNAWISHLRVRDEILVRLLRENRIVTCDVVIGELLLGIGLSPALIRDLALLPKLPSPSAEHTRNFIERRRRVFRGSGIDWADSQILVSAANAGALIYSSDKAMRKVWRKLGFRLI